MVRALGRRLVDRDAANDLAAILIKRPEPAPLRVDDTEPTAGTLTACGYGSDGRFRPATGTIDGMVQAVGASFPSVKITNALCDRATAAAECSMRLDCSWALSGVVAMAKRTSPVGDRFASFSTAFGPKERGESREKRSRESAPSSSTVPIPIADFLHESNRPGRASRRCERASKIVASICRSVISTPTRSGPSCRRSIPASLPRMMISGVETDAKSLVESLHTKLHAQFDEQLGQIMPAVAEQIAAVESGTSCWSFVRKALRRHPRRQRTAGDCGDDCGRVGRAKAEATPIGRRATATAPSPHVPSTTRSQSPSTHHRHRSRSFPRRTIVPVEARRLRPRPSMGQRARCPQVSRRARKC